MKIHQPKHHSFACIQRVISIARTVEWCFISHRICFLSVSDMINIEEKENYVTIL